MHSLKSLMTMVSKSRLLTANSAIILKKSRNRDFYEIAPNFFENHCFIEPCPSFNFYPKLSDYRPINEEF